MSSMAGRRRKRARQKICLARLVSAHPGSVRSPAGRDLVRGQDLELIVTCAELTHFGIEPKNLRQYVAAANRETPMFEQALASISRHQGESEGERALRRELTLDRMLELTGFVRRSLIRRELLGDERSR